MHNYKELKVWNKAVELATQLTIANNLTYVKHDDFQLIDTKIIEVQKMIFRLKETIDSKV